MTHIQQKPHTKVGIFWCVYKTIIGEAVQQENGEPYGDAIQYGGHYEFWKSLVAVTVQERKFKTHSYDYFPRGRMVLFPNRRTVRLYVDRCMDDDTIKAALQFFGSHDYEIEIENDEHYKCAGCNRNFLE